MLYCQQKRWISNTATEVKKRMRATLLAIQDELKRLLHEPAQVVGQWLDRVVSGYFNSHAVPGNLIRLGGWGYAVYGGKYSSDAASVTESSSHATDGLPISTWLDPVMHILILRVASRYVPKAGAVCGSSACTDMRGDGRQLPPLPRAFVGNAELDRNDVVLASSVFLQA